MDIYGIFYPITVEYTIFLETHKCSLKQITFQAIKHVLANEKRNQEIIYCILSEHGRIKLENNSKEIVCIDLQ